MSNNLSRVTEVGFGVKLSSNCSINYGIVKAGFYPKRSEKRENNWSISSYVCPTIKKPSFIFLNTFSSTSRQQNAKQNKLVLILPTTIVHL